MSGGTVVVVGLAAFGATLLIPAVAALWLGLAALVALDAVLLARRPHGAALRVRRGH